jgi:hypothetical protein
LDETALLALGILAEELCQEILGDTGDMVFTEGEARETSGRQCEESVIHASAAARKSGRTRSRKKRRVNVEAAMDVVD